MYKIEVAATIDDHGTSGSLVVVFEGEGVAFGQKLKGREVMFKSC